MNNYVTVIRGIKKMKSRNAISTNRMKTSSLLIILFSTILIICVLMFFTLVLKQARKYYFIIPSHIKWNSYFTPKHLIPDDVSEQPMNQHYFQDKRVIICGLLRGKEEQIKYLKESIKPITNQFQDWAFVCVENDSHDRTREYLLNWQKEDPDHVFILGCGLNQTSCKLNIPLTTIHDANVKRISKMVKLRNEYMEFIHNHPNLKEYEFTIMQDLDLKSFLYMDGLWNTAYHFARDESIDAISAFGLQLVPSFIHKGSFIAGMQDPFCLVQTEKDIDRNQKIDDVLSIVKNRYLYGQGLVKLVSAFNGFAIYRTKSILNLRYELQTNSRNKAICEHVTLHRKLKNFYMNCNLLNMITENCDGFKSTNSNLKVKINSNTSR